MAIKAQNCYEITPISSFLSLGIILLSNYYLLYPFVRKLCILCAQDFDVEDVVVVRGNRNVRDRIHSIPQSLTVEELTASWDEWLNVYGSPRKAYALLGNDGALNGERENHFDGEMVQEAGWKHKEYCNYDMLNPILVSS